MGYLRQLSRLSFVAKPKRRKRETTADLCTGERLNAPLVSRRQADHLFMQPPAKPPRTCIVSSDGGATEEVQTGDQRWPDDPQWSPDAINRTKE